MTRWVAIDGYNGKAERLIDDGGNWLGTVWQRFGECCWARLFPDEGYTGAEVATLDEARAQLLAHVSANPWTGRPTPSPIGR